MSLVRVQLGPNEDVGETFKTSKKLIRSVDGQVSRTQESALGKKAIAVMPTFSRIRDNSRCKGHGEQRVNKRITIVDSSTRDGSQNQPRPLLAKNRSIHQRRIFPLCLRIDQRSYSTTATSFLGNSLSVFAQQTLAICSFGSRLPVTIKNFI